MALAGRNDPCPCGSGSKYKRCGFDRTLERALEERLEATEALARLAYLSPRLVPESDAYDAWVQSVLAGEIELDANAAIRTLGEDEPGRIVSACLELYPDAWEALSSSAGSARDAVAALLAGSVAAGIRDYGSIHRRSARHRLARAPARPARPPRRDPAAVRGLPARERRRRRGLPGVRGRRALPPPARRAPPRRPRRPRRAGRRPRGVPRRLTRGAAYRPRCG